MADGDFKRLFDGLCESDYPRQEIGIDSMKSSPISHRAGLDMIIAEADLDELLVKERTATQEPLTKMTTEENSAEDTNAGSDSITDDEFEALLDELHGPSGAPRAVGAISETSSNEEEQGNDDSGVDECLELILDPTMVIAQVGDFHERLCSLLDETQKIGLKAAEVNVIDTANLQLIFAFMRDRQSRGRETVIYKPSDTFMQSVRMLGMETCLGLNG